MLASVGTTTSNNLTSHLYPKSYDIEYICYFIYLAFI